MDKELNALISLLEDPSDEVFEVVEQNLRNRGISVIPELEKAWENSLDEKLQQRIETIIQYIQFQDTLTRFELWFRTEDNDLQDGAFWIAKYQYPEINQEVITSLIEVITNDVRAELNDSVTPLEKVKTLNHIFFEVFKFTRNTANYNSPQNSYINQVLQSRKGNSISLAIIYMLVANKLNLPIYGVNLPINFILAFLQEKDNSKEISDESRVLFYINPFNRGAVLGKKEIDYFVAQQKLTSQKSFYVPCTKIEIIDRLIVTLISSYENLGYSDKIKDLKRMRTVLKQKLD